MKKTNHFVLLFFILFLLHAILASTIFVSAAPKKMLNKKSLSMTEKQTYTLKLKGVNKKNIKWSSSNNAVASVNNGVVKAKKKGKCNICAKSSGKKYKCVVRVKKKSTEDIYSKVTLSAKYIAAEGKLLLRLSNGTDRKVAFSWGGDRLEQLVNGIWEEVPEKESAPLSTQPAILVQPLVKPKEKWSEEIKLDDYYDNITTGKYRISKKVDFIKTENTKAEKIIVSAKFTIP